MKHLLIASVRPSGPPWRGTCPRLEVPPHRYRADSALLIGDGPAD